MSTRWSVVSQDWSEAPDIASFVGRSDELHTLRNWLVDERRRLAIVGMAGIGKTSLAARLAHNVAPASKRSSGAACGLRRR
jgi:MoxR-like ATPase